MSKGPVDDAKLKDLFKAALVEVLEERRDLFRDLLEEALEDIGMRYAIEEGLRGRNVSRDDVFSILNGGR